MKTHSTKKAIIKVIVAIITFYFMLFQQAQGKEKGFEQLVTELNSSSVELRIDAAWALGELGDKRAVDYLVKALNDPDDRMRYYVVKALENLGDDKAVPKLERALNIEIQPWVVQALKEAIDKIKH